VTRNPHKASRVMPKVWNRRDPLCPGGPIYVGRPTKWGNPFRASEVGRARAIEAYRGHLLASPTLMADLHELRGRDLVCWCAPLPCHADVLLELANSLPPWAGARYRGQMDLRRNQPCANPDCDAAGPHPRCFKDGNWLDSGEPM